MPNTVDILVVVMMPRVITEIKQEAKNIYIYRKGLQIFLFFLFFSHYPV